MLMLGIVNGFLGYSLPDDLVSGTGIRIAYSIIESMPLVGSYLGFFLFGGNYPGNGIIIPRFFIIHVLILPVIIGGLSPRTSGCWSNRSTPSSPVRGRPSTTWSARRCSRRSSPRPPGSSSWSRRCSSLLGGFAQINPIWQFGQYEPYQISYAVQPDWYMGWLDGALRIMPSWEWIGWGHTIPLEVFLPAVLFPGLIVQLLLSVAVRRNEDTPKTWPTTTCWTGRATDRSGRPSVPPYSCSISCCSSASSTDVMANFFKVPLNTVLWFFRIAVFVIPIITYFVTYQICNEMRAAEGIGKRKRAMVVSRSAEGAYSTVVTEPRPGDDAHELEAIPVPTYINLTPEELETAPGVRRVMR